MPRSRLRSSPARPARPPEQAARTRAPAPAGAAPDGDEDGPALPALDGRRRHPIDRALDFRALERGGLSGAQIARRRRKSPGYVSVLLRLGRALEALDPAEQAAFRSPRVTIGLIQRLVRVGVPDAELRAQLRAAVSGVSRHNVDRRRARTRRAGEPGADGPDGAPRSGDPAGRSAEPVGRPADRSAPATAASGTATGAAHMAPADREATGPLAGRALAGLAGWAWDQALWEADPERYVEDLLARVVGLQRTVLARAQRAVREGGALRLDAGQSLGQLARRLGGRSAARAEPGAVAPPPAGATPAERRALEALGVWGAGLLAASEGARRSLAAPGGAPVPGPVAAPGAGDGAIGWADVEADLGDG